MIGNSAAIMLAAGLLLQQTAAGSPDTVIQVAERAVLSAYRRMEEADRKGDGKMWLALRDRATQSTMNEALKETIGKGGHSRPSVQYEPLATRVVADRGVILGKVTDPEGHTVQYDAVLFTVEDGEWKVAREQLSEKPFDRFVLFALLEPEEGSFFHDGEPWRIVPYAAYNAGVVRKEDVIWKIQATFDESFVYLRFESELPVPAAGSKLRPETGKANKTGGPPPPPAMRIKISSASEYEVSVSSLVSTTPVVNAKGKAAGSHYTLAYSLFVKNGAGDEVFENTVGEGSSSALLTVGDRFIDVRIPLAGLVTDLKANQSIYLEEAGTVMHVLPYHVDAYTGR